MYKEKLKQSGFKLTTPRLLVLCVLEKAKKPLSAKEIYRSIESQVDLASVYRTLRVLEKVMVVFVERRFEEDFYYLAYAAHHHIRCRGCGAVECVPCDHVLTKVRGFVEVEHEMVLTGICEGCRVKKEGRYSISN